MPDTTPTTPIEAEEQACSCGCTAPVGLCTCHDCETSMCYDCDRSINGEYNVCQSCYDNNYYTCEHCDHVCSSSTIIRAQNDNYICPACFEDNYSTCNDCSETMHTDDVNHVLDRCVCDSCYRNDYFTCSRCSQINHNGNREDCGDCGNAYCESCVSDHECACITSRDNGGINLESHGLSLARHGASSITNYHQRCNWQFVSDKLDSKHEPFIGIELEIEANRANESLHKACQYVGQELAGKVMCSHDGSIAYGMELVFTPMKRQAVRKLNFKKILKGLSKRGCTSFSKGTCGLHIHIQRIPWFKKSFIYRRETFTNAEVYQMFYNHLKLHITKLSRRKSGQMARYCAFNQTKDRRGPRYSAINLENAKTVEVRIWRGTLEPERLRANILFSLSVLDFLKSHSAALMLGYFYGRNVRGKRGLEHTFREWLEKQSEYQSLVKYLKHVGLFGYPKPKKSQVSPISIDSVSEERNENLLNLL